ncbi:hypothetical protein A5638_25355 [Mycolicibacterium fortuitum]|uniref:hypothetical protein n=1 Tax=Mycolicibacterium fortuitum TaxID=1766 RepID=UPI0007EC440F|nr:hypothetical protein [Mycolicibacterium fortuitum]OBJ93650.1 hypothetical protein A5638_25355 [Mycolicibacterium fortuitum]
MAEQLTNWFAEELDEQAVWSTLKPGPAVDEVAARMASTPQPFLADTVDLVALACDVFNHTGCAAATQRIAERGSPASRRGAAIGLWLFASAELIGPFTAPLDERKAATALLALAFRVAPLVDPGRWLSDAERRDEAVRTFLLWNGLLPSGEDAVQARSLFEMRDSVRREGALAQALADHEHRMAVQRRLADARAKEAAARYNSE